MDEKAKKKNIDFKENNSFIYHHVGLEPIPAVSEWAHLDTTWHCEFNSQP